MTDRENKEYKNEMDLRKKVVNAIDDSARVYNFYKSFYMELCEALIIQGNLNYNELSDRMKQFIIKALIDEKERIEDKYVETGR